ncbi:D-sedoheptulose-7-phosphate isomerase [Caproicibacter fermentans]|uniref:SIS domain-containing protein n=1 Tax=Caproicibacter fermentans TaxID=2576756 RepID=A0A7G8TFN7_9FIRM|nr:SIS domain-containing protein [Caproicibacter fermentans]QNK42428.1 SIS domain-containing protein [Caproicibacter fermentans]
MKEKTQALFQDFLQKQSFLSTIEQPVLQAFDMLLHSYQNQGKLLICGNGGSAADADHIAGELVKAFRLKRPLLKHQIQAYEVFGNEAVTMAEKLQGSLPAISLCAHNALLTAIINDLGSDVMYAQQVLGFGNSGDILLGISTSGNASNVLNAAIVAKTLGMKSILLSGKTGGKGKGLFDLSIIVPSDETSDIQDMHSVVYHALCAMLESEFWDD